MWSGENAEKIFGIVSHIDTFVKVSITIYNVFSLLHLVVSIDILKRKLFIDCLIKTSMRRRYKYLTSLCNVRTYISYLYLSSFESTA